VEQINAPLLSTGNIGENIGWLVPLEGPQIGELFQIRGKSIIGSAQGCDIRIMDASISGRHAEIRVDGQNRFRITDLGSRNGTYVNDKRIESTDLVDGDNIRLGRTTFRFKTRH
ncbi:MAG: FHA domain-containing protein, partial [Myxococcales bacterium]|nr:FHA domain-containing protein [Myxococcales bacterium]